MTPRRTGRTRTVASTTTTTESSAPAAAPLLQFDFEGRARTRASAAPTEPVRELPNRDASIKEAIVRWLNEQL